jgi:hypothetical protein
VRRVLAVRLFAALGLLALAGACETMSVDECRVADWRALGYQDGSNGLSLDKYSAREKSCAKAGIAAQFDPYSGGRAEGLSSFCRPERGFRAALNGYVYKGVCPASAEPDFLLGYDDGRMAYQATSAVSGLRSDIDSVKYRLDDYDRQIRDNRRTLDDSKATQEEKEKARKRIDELRDDRKSAERDLRGKEDDLYWRENDLDRVRGQIGLRWGSW